MSETLIVGVGGTLLGAVVGALASGWVTGLVEARKRHEATRIATISAIDKLTRMIINYRMIIAWYEAGQEMSAERGFDYISRALNGFLAPFEIITFEVGEIFPIIRMGGGIDVNVFRNVEAAYRPTIEAVNDYSVRRLALGKQLPGEIEGDVIRFQINDEAEAKRVAFEFHTLSGPLAETDKHIAEGYARIEAAMQKITKAAGIYFATDAKTTYSDLRGDGLQEVKAWPSGPPRDWRSRLRHKLRGI